MQHCLKILGSNFPPCLSWNGRGVLQAFHSVREWGYYTEKVQIVKNVVYFGFLKLFEKAGTKLYNKTHKTGLFKAKVKICF